MAVFNSKVFNPKVFNTDYEAEQEAIGDAWLGPPIPKPSFPIHLIKLIHDWLKSKVGD